MDPDAQDSLFLWENTTVHLWREKKDAPHFTEWFRGEVLSTMGCWKQGLPTPAEEPDQLAAFEGHGWSTTAWGHHSIGCRYICWCADASLAYILNMANAGEKSPQNFSFSHLPFWPSKSHWLHFSQRDNPLAFILTLCLILHFNKRGRSGSLGLTWEWFPQDPQKWDCSVMNVRSLFTHLPQRG